MEAIVSGGAIKKSAVFESQVSLNNFEHNFKKRTATKVYPVAQIVKQEKGKEGLEDMKKKQIELDVQNIGLNKEKSAKPELTVKKTLEVKGKETRITSTIKKKLSKPVKKIVKKKGSKHLASGNLGKKRVVPKKGSKGSKDETVTISKGDFDAYIERIRKEERAKLSGKASIKKGK